MNRGVAYSIQNKFADALKDLNKAIELEPRKVDGYHNRALVLTKLGMLLEATTDYTTAIELNHRDVELYVARARIWEELNQPDKAIADYGSAVAIQPTNEQVLRRLTTLGAQRSP